MVDTQVDALECAIIVFVRDKYYGCGTMAEVCLGEVIRDHDTGEWMRLWCMLREGVRITLMLAEESVASSEIMMMAMASASASAIACTCLE